MKLSAPPSHRRAAPYPRIRVIDAVADDGEGPRKGRRKKKVDKQAASALNRDKRKEKEQQQEVPSSADADAEMAALDRRFADLLGDYLKGENAVQMMEKDGLEAE